MSQIGEFNLTEVGVEASQGLRAMVVDALKGRPVAMYVNEDPIPWQTFADGSWDLIGAPEADGGAGASLRDLICIAQTWGEYVLPSPLMATIMAKRFSSAARQHAGPVSFGMKTRAGGDAFVIPFGNDTNVRIVSNISNSSLPLVEVTTTPDDFAPSLRLAEGAAATQWNSDAATEMALVWAAEATGCAIRMLDMAVAYAKERQQFGEPIGKFQSIKHYLANAHMLTELSETATIMGSQDITKARAAAMYALDSSINVIETAIQVHGGLGFTWEMGIHIYLRHAITLREFVNELPA